MFTAQFILLVLIKNVAFEQQLNLLNSFSDDPTRLSEGPTRLSEGHIRLLEGPTRL